jgi:fumarylacetoacetase
MLAGIEAALYSADVMKEQDDTCDPELCSWVESANARNADFPIQNLPFGIFRDDNYGCVCIGVAIGDCVLDLHAIADERLLPGLPFEVLKACRKETLNDLMALGPAAASALRLQLSRLLCKDADRATQQRVEKYLFHQGDVTMLMPAQIGDYTDFYASIDHATRAGKLFRPDNPLLPNYKHVPIGYHGRASSLVVSGASVRRPRGQFLQDGVPVFAATRMLDYEVELGVFAGPGNALGEPVPIDQASGHIFGCCLVNDWSARDIQAWEYQPLGPFLAKSFATSLSPWVVTMDALSPFRVPARARGANDPEPLPYLDSKEDRKNGGFDVHLEVHLLTEAMRESKQAPVLLSHSNTRDLYWTISQILTHHASNGCNLRPGDLYATGTVSGAGDKARGCLLEFTERGARPITLPNGEQRGFLEDGDEVILRGYCQRAGAARIGFGECRGLVRSILF